MGLSVANRRDTLRWAGYFFLYGAAFHLLLLRWIAHTDYQTPSDKSLIDHPLVNIGFAVLGGLFVVIRFLPFIRRALGHSQFKMSQIALPGIACGAFATIATFMVFFVCCGIYLALLMSFAVPGVGFLTSFELAMIDILTYGLGTMLEHGRFAILNGILLSFGVFWLSRRFGRKDKQYEKLSA